MRLIGSTRLATGSKLSIHLKDPQLFTWVPQLCISWVKASRKSKKS
jgi:hypothetical protein